MRVTESLILDRLTQSLMNSSWNMARLNEKLATQKEVLRPSDDPSATALIMRMNSHIEALQLYAVAGKRLFDAPVHSLHHLAHGVALNLHLGAESVVDQGKAKQHCAELGRLQAYPYLAGAVRPRQHAAMPDDPLE